MGRQDVRARCQRRKFLKKVIGNLAEQIKCEGAPTCRAELVRKKEYYEAQLNRL
jgi:hypothetical protein